MKLEDIALWNLNTSFYLLGPSNPFVVAQNNQGFLFNRKQVRIIDFLKSRRPELTGKSLSNRFL